MDGLNFSLLFKGCIMMSFMFTVKKTVFTCLLTIFTFVIPLQLQAAYNSCHTQLITQTTTCLTFSPDGRMLAVGLEKSIIIFTLNPTTRTWEQVDQLEYNKNHYQSDEIRSMIFSPDGTMLAVALKTLGKSFILIYSYDSGQKIWELTQTPTEIMSTASVMTMSHDGKIIALGSDDGTITLWRFDSDKKICEHLCKLDATLNGHTKTVSSLAFSLNGTLASGSWDESVRIWNFDLETQVYRHFCTLDHNNGGHTQSLSSVTFSFDGENLITGSYDSTIKIWQYNPTTESYKRMYTTQQINGCGIYALAISPDGTIASASQDKKIKLWNLNATNGTCHLIQSLEDHRALIHALSFSSDRTLASISRDNSMKIWRPNDTIDSVKNGASFIPYDPVEDSKVGAPFDEEMPSQIGKRDNDTQRKSPTRKVAKPN